MNSSILRRFSISVLGLCCALVVSVGAADFSQPVSRSFTLGAGGRLKVDNVNGSIRVQAGDGATVQVEAVKRARREADLERVEVVFKQEGSRLSIHTQHTQATKQWFLSSWGNSAWVDYTITVPRDVRVEGLENVNGVIEVRDVKGPIRASTVNGSLHVSGLTSSATLSTVNGGLTASFKSLESGDKAKLETVNGGVTVTFADGVQAQLKAETVNGGIHTAGLLGMSEKPSRHQFTGRLGSASNPGTIQVSTVNGGVTLKAESAVKP